jgi:radical SAM superfamily enzyme YgiQ (UPF0313 family)
MLINPPRFNGIPIVREIRCAGTSPVSIYPPIDLAYLASYLRKSFEISLLDANALDLDWNEVQKEIEKIHPDAVLFKTSPTTMFYDMKLADITKSIDKNIITILDDAHIAPIFPEKTLNTFKNLDILVKGESEKTTKLLMEALSKKEKLDNVTGISFRDGDKIINTEPTKPENLDNLPFPAYDMLPIDKYNSITFARKSPFMTLVSSRGCPFNCDFCIVGGSTVWRGSGKGWYPRSSKNILEEMEMLVNTYGIKEIYIFDETFTVNKDRVMEVCKGMKDRKIKVSWSCNSRVDTLDEEMLKAMKESGCWNILFGVESGSQKILDSIQKRIKIETIKKAFEITKKSKICASASFMVGLPGETWDTVEETLKLALELEPDFCQFVLTTPYPGTRLYDYVKKNNLLIKDYDFQGYDAYGLAEGAVMRTESMTSKELMEAQRYLEKKFYIRPKYIIKKFLSIRSFLQIKMMIEAFVFVNGWNQLGRKKE